MHRKQYSSVNYLPVSSEVQYYHPQGSCILPLLTILTSDYNQARGIGGRTDNTDGISGSHSELVAFICCQPGDSVLAVMYISQVGFEPAAMSLAFLDVVAGNLATTITFRCIPFQCHRVTSHICVVRLARRI